MNGKQFVFICGLHKSGTSLLHEILRSHPAMSGFANTGVPEDEGQHLQTVYPTARVFGGAGRFGFDPASFMDEHHPLATVENSEKLFAEWSRYWDQDRQYYLEKSPPNLVRTRFLSQLFPESSFIVILRHPVAVAYATQKWSRTNISSLIEHSLRCYERFQADAPHLNRLHVLRYEEFVTDPRAHLSKLLQRLDASPFDFKNEVLPDVNGKYFKLWASDRRDWLKMISNKEWGLLFKRNDLERRTRQFGYSLKDPQKLLPFSLAGGAPSIADAPL